MPNVRPVNESDYPRLRDMVIAKILAMDLRPEPNSNRWAGRNAVIHYLRTGCQLTISIEQAEEILNEAVDLIWGERPDIPQEIRRRLSIRRLEWLRERIIGMLITPSVKREYKHEPPPMGPDGKKLNKWAKSRRVLVKETIESPPAVLIKELREIEALLGKWYSFDDNVKDDNKMAKLLDHLEEASASAERVTTTATAKISIARQVRKMSATDLGLKKKKHVESNVVEPGPEQQQQPPAALPDPTTLINPLDALDAASEPVEREVENLTPPTPPPDASSEPI